MSNIRKGPWNKTQINGTDVASPEVPEYHAAMTDITRQQVADMLTASEAKVDARLANFDTSVKEGFAGIRTEMADMRAAFADLRTEMANGRTDAGKQNHDSMKWIIGTIITMVSISVAVIGLFINLSKSDKAPTAQPAAIVITVPGATVAPTQAPAAK